MLLHEIPTHFLHYVLVSPPWGKSDTFCTCDVQRCPVLSLYLNTWSLCCRCSLVREDRRPGQRAPVPGRTLPRGSRGARRSGRGRHGSTIAAGRTLRRLLTELLFTKKKAQRLEVRFRGFGLPSFYPTVPKSKICIVSIGVEGRGAADRSPRST